MKVWTSPALVQQRRLKSGLYMGHGIPRVIGGVVEKPTLGRSEASYPPRRSDVPLSYTFYRCSRSSENRISSEAVQIHACEGTIDVHMS